jgi:hypothetical protein
MLKKYLIVATVLCCNIQSMALNPDVNQQDNGEVVSCIKWLKELNRNPGARAADIQAGINLCDNTLAELTQGGAIQKNKRPFEKYKAQLRLKILAVSPNSTPLNPDTNPNDKSLVVGYLNNLRQLDINIKNSTAKAVDILAGINLCRNTLDRLQKGGATDKKNKTQFKMYEAKLNQKFSDEYPRLTLA